MELVTGYGFTFQYVSINTIASQNTAKSQENLHSNMFLLIHFLGCWLAWKDFIYIPICFY